MIKFTRGLHDETKIVCALRGWAALSCMRRNMRSSLVALLNEVIASVRDSSIGVNVFQSSEL